MKILLKTSLTLFFGLLLVLPLHASTVTAMSKTVVAKAAVRPDPAAAARAQGREQKRKAVEQILKINRRGYGSHQGNAR